MGSVANELPIELQNPSSKDRVIFYLRDLALPSRHKRGVLQDWGNTYGVEITPADYELVASPLSAGIERGAR